MTRRPAGSADWVEPGAHPVAPGVHRIPLPLPFDGLDAVNCYVFEGPSGLILVDPGWAMPETERTVRDGLRELGHDLGDIAVCVATHHHWDHYTQAYRWRDTLGTELWIGREERHSITEFAGDTRRFPHHVALLTRCGAGELAQRVAEGTVAGHERDIPYGAPDRWLHDGERIAVEGGSVEVVETPGHTRGHIVLHHPEAGVLLSGDHILPRITPSLGFEWSPEPQPLRSFLASLEAMLALPDAVVLPAHGPELASTHARVREQIQHHDERLAEVLDLLGHGAETAFEVALALPWTRRRRALSDLPLDHQMIAVSEISAHLELLLLLDRVVVRTEAGVRRFTPARAPARCD